MPLRSLVIFSLLFASPFALAQSTSDLSARIDQYIEAERARQKIPGVAVAVIRRGQVLKAQGYGEANVEHGVPVTPATVFQSGSVGKAFTAAAVMLLVEDGKLALEDTLPKFFAEAPESWRTITVRNLLTHTSGIPDVEDGRLDMRRDYAEDDLAAVFKTYTLEFAPGTRFNYSNTGYVLLGIIVHKVSGMFYGDVLAERVFKPLAMNATRVISEVDIVRHRAAGYRLVNGELKNQEWVAPLLNTTADGSIYVTLEDMITWDAALRAGKVLKPESWRAVYQPVRLASGRTYPYGFAWEIDRRNGRLLYHHGGSWQGFKSYISRYIDDDFTVIVLANLAQINPGQLADGVAALVEPTVAIAPLRPIRDREPRVTAKLQKLLEAAAAGSWKPADFAFAPEWFFREAAPGYEKRLRELGPVQKLELLQRTELGDDTIYTYDAHFAIGRWRYTVGVAPDGRYSEFALRNAP